MALRSGYDTYAQNRITMASPAEITLMLYEGAIKFCNIAIVACEQKEIEKAHVNITKVENIIMEFQSTLDRKYPVAKYFDDVYSYIYQRLIEANMEKSAEILEEVLEHLRGMRDTWKEVMEKTNNGANVKR